MLPLSGPQLGTLPATQACALTRNRTGDLSVHRPASNPLSHTSPNWFLVILNNQLSLQGYQPWSRTNLFPRPSLLSPHSPLRTHKLGDLFSVTDSYLQALANPTCQGRAVQINDGGACGHGFPFYKPLHFTSKETEAQRRKVTEL